MIHVQTDSEQVKKRFSEEEIISGSAILERWSCFPAEYLTALVDDKDIAPYYITGKATAHDGRLFYICISGIVLSDKETVDGMKYDFKKTVFAVSEVTEIEKNNPELLCTIECVVGDDFRKENVRHVKFSTLDDCSESETRVLHLERGKAVRTAKTWGQYLEASVKLSAYVIESCHKGHAPFTKDELDRACSEMHIVALTEEAMRIFRRSIPAKYINFGGRPPKV